MSLDELRKKQEELRRQQEEIKRKKAERKKQDRDLQSNKPIQKKPINLPSQIEATIGDMNVLIDQQLLNTLLHKIWFLDAPQSSLDQQISQEIKDNPHSFNIPMDKTAIIQKIRDEVYFVPITGPKMSYNEFRLRWTDFWDDLTQNYNPKRKEFVQLLTNHFKNRWVDRSGHQIPEEMFQLIYRLEREPKAVERLLEFTQSHYFELINDQNLNMLSNRFRSIISKIIRNELLNFLQNSSLTTQKSKKHPLHPVGDLETDLDDDIDDLDDDL